MAGEIAHVENVLPHELKRRVHSRTDETETTDTAETETTTTDQRDSQTTERFELSDASKAETSLAVHVDAQVDTSGQYGPTKVDTHLGGSIDFSREEAESHAQTTAHEIVTSAVHRVEEWVLNRRTVRSLTRIRDKDIHQLDNRDDEPVVGMYRWIDKVIRLQRYRYPHRYLLEFQVPEPAAYVRWLDRRAADRFPRPGAGSVYEHRRAGRSGCETAPADRRVTGPGLADVLPQADEPVDAEHIEPPPRERVTASGFLHLASSDPGTDKPPTTFTLLPPREPHRAAVRRTPRTGRRWWCLREPGGHQLGGLADDVGSGRYGGPRLQPAQSRQGKRCARHVGVGPARPVRNRRRQSERPGRHRSGPQPHDIGAQRCFYTPRGSAPVAGLGRCRSL